MIETPDMMYGALKANVDTSGLTLAKALNKFKHLLEGDKWKEVGDGFTDIDEFLKTIDLSDFKFAIEQRKEVALKLELLQASQRASALALGVGKSTLNRDLNPVPHGTKQQKSTTENQPLTQTGVPHGTSKDLFNKEVKKVETKADFIKKVETQKQNLKEQPPPEIDGNFDVVVLDPPWNYGREYDPETSRVANPYPEMNQQELKDLNIPVNDNAVIWLWTTHQFIWDAKELLTHWGFDYKALLVWDKENIGMGHWLRMQAEFCLLAIKGKPIWDNKSYRDIIREKRREHSRKPDAFYKMVDDICYGSKLDFFSREPREGWTSFGDDINKF